MYMGAADGDDPPPEMTGPPVEVPSAAWLALTICLVVTLVVGFFPQTLLDFANDAIPVLVVGAP